VARRIDPLTPRTPIAVDRYDGHAVLANSLALRLAGITSSTSLISFRLEELSKHLTTGRGKSYWFMLEPLLMSKSVFDALPKAQQDAIISVGLEMEKFGLEGAKADDIKVAEVYQKVGAKVHDLDAAMVEKWRAIARDTAWKDYAGKTEFSANLLKSAQEVTA